MAHYGNVLASSYRDKIVDQAINKNKAAINYQKGNNFTAELFDFGGNLILGAVPQTIMVFGIVIPYFSTSVQGWIGGIVSIDSNNKRRFENFKSAFYHLFVLLLAEFNLLLIHWLSAQVSNAGLISTIIT